jgi:hypothetical protein
LGIEDCSETTGSGYEVFRMKIYIFFLLLLLAPPPSLFLLILLVVFVFVVVLVVYYIVMSLVKEARFATLNKAALNAMDDGGIREMFLIIFFSHLVKFSILIVNAFNGAPSKLQRNLVIPSLKVK